MSGNTFSFFSPLMHRLAPYWTYGLVSVGLHGLLLFGLFCFAPVFKKPVELTLPLGLQSLEIQFISPISPPSPPTPVAADPTAATLPPTSPLAPLASSRQNPTPNPAKPPAKATLSNDHAGVKTTMANSIYNPKPTYPEVLRRQGVEGKVVLVVRITPEGSVSKIMVVQGSGHDEFDQAALKVVSQWRFTPAKMGNCSVESLAQIPIIFTLDKK